MNPLFVEDLTELKTRLRLTGIPPGKDAESILFEAIESVRANFLIELGEVRIAQILTTTLDRETTTDAGMVRLLAAVTETKWVYREVLSTMSVLVVEGTSTIQSWNEEGVYRDKTPELISQLQDKLHNDIQRGLDILRDGGVQEDQGLSVSVIGPAETPPKPGEFLDLLTCLE